MERAFSITGNMYAGSESMPVIAVLFIPAPFCPYMLSNNLPHMKLLKRMDFDKSNVIRVEACKIPEAGIGVHDAPTLYYFERCPQPSKVLVATLGFEGSACGLKLREETRAGSPHEIIPVVDSSMVRAHIYRNALPLSGFPVPKAPVLDPRPKKQFTR